MKITDLKKQNGDFGLHIKKVQFVQGKVHGIIGSNGSGKTTLAKVLMGMLPYDSGNLDYQGLTPLDITMTGQKPYLLHSSVYQNLIYPLKVRKQTIDEKQVDDWLDKAGLLEKKKQYALSLSSGEQQKLSFIRALIFNPKLVIIDETFSNLDPDSVELFEQLIQKRQQENPITWLTISHQLVHIQKMCDYVHFMEKGDVIVTDTPHNLFTNPTHEAVKKYLANTQVTFKG